MKHHQQQQRFINNNEVRGQHLLARP